MAGFFGYFSTGGHLKPDTCKPFSRIFRVCIFRILLLRGIFLDYFCGERGTFRHFPHFPRTGFKSLILKIRPTGFVKTGLRRLGEKLLFAKPMFCMWVASHANDRNQENDKTDKDNSDIYKQGVERWRNHGNYGNDEHGLHPNPSLTQPVNPSFLMFNP